MLAETTEMLGPMAKPLKLAFIGFCIAALGVGVGFLIDYGPQNMALSFVCFMVVAVGVGIGFVGIAKGWRAQFAATVQSIADRRAAQARDASRPEIRAFEPSEDGEGKSQSR